jgi:hypothetical protein
MTSVLKLQDVDQTVVDPTGGFNSLLSLGCGGDSQIR